jgi:hypothetical protein
LTSATRRSFHGAMGMSRDFTFAPEVDVTKASTGAFSALLDERSPEVRDRAVLLIEELLAGSALSAPDVCLDVRLISDPGTVRVEVRDGGGGVVLGSLRQAPDASSAGGWSPHLLSTMADRWGLVSGSEGAWVWFELDTAAASGRP